MNENGLTFPKWWVAISGSPNARMVNIPEYLVDAWQNGEDPADHYGDGNEISQCHRGIPTPIRNKTRKVA